MYICVGVRKRGQWHHWWSYCFLYGVQCPTCGPRLQMDVFNIEDGRFTYIDISQLYMCALCDSDILYYDSIDGWLIILRPLPCLRVENLHRVLLTNAQMQHTSRKKKNNKTKLLQYAFAFAGNWNTYECCWWSCISNVDRALYSLTPLQWNEISWISLVSQVL